MIKIKPCKFLEVKPLQITVLYTAIMYNAGRKAEILDEFGFWAPGIIKKNIIESFQVSFCGCTPMHAFFLLY